MRGSCGVNFIAARESASGSGGVSGLTDCACAAATTKPQPINANATPKRRNRMVIVSSSKQWMQTISYNIYGQALEIYLEYLIVAISGAYELRIPEGGRC